MEDKSIIKLVQERWEAGSNGKNCVKDSQQNINLFIGARVESDNSRPGQGESVYINLPMIGIEKINSLASDTPIDMLVSPSIPNYDLDAQIYQQITKHVKERNYDDEKRPAMQKYSLLAGTGIYKVWYNAEKNEIKYKALDPKNIVVDPVARQVEDIRWIIQIAEYTRGEIKEKWGKELSKKIDSINVDTSGDDIEQFNMSDDETNELIRVYEMWAKDDAKKYPDGRYVVCTDMDVLEDVPNDYKCGFPYVFIPCVQVPDRVFGVGLFNYIREIADFLNKLMSRILTIIKLQSNQQVAVNVLSGIDADGLSNEDGLVIKVKGDVRQAIMPISQAPLAPELLQLVQTLEYYINVILGAQDITPPTGGQISNLPSGRALEEFQQNTQTRLREFVRNIKRGYRMLGEKIIAIAHQYMNDETIIKITGSDAQTIMQVMGREYNEALQKLNQAGAKTEQELDAGIKLMMSDKGLSVRKVDNNSAYMGFIGNRLGDPNNFMVDVKGGIDVPKGKLDISQRADMLMGQGMLDMQTYLEAIDFPLKQKVLERSPQWQAFLQFQAMQAQQAQMQQKEAQRQQIQAMRGGQDAPQGQEAIVDTELGADADAPINDEQPVAD